MSRRVVSLRCRRGQEIEIQIGWLVLVPMHLCRATPTEARVKVRAIVSVVENSMGVIVWGDG